MGYPLDWKGPGMPTPCFSDEPGAGFGNFNGPDVYNQDPRDWWGPAIGMRPLGHLHSEPPAKPAAPPKTAQAEPKAPEPRPRRYDLTVFPQAVLTLPSAIGMLHEIAGDAVMELDLPSPKALAGAVLEHASAAVACRIQPGEPFKIGITTNPIHRWHNVRYGYRQSAERFDRMILLLATDSGPAAAFLEAALISRFKKFGGCRNVASGGESLKPTIEVFFTYLVIKGGRRA